MRAAILLGLSCCIAFTCIPAISQSSGMVRAHIEGIDIPPLANAPFTAKVLVTWEEPLVGGGTAARKYYTLVARDSEGRVRRETREFVPANSNAEPPLRTFTVFDPVSSTRTTCAKTSMTCATSAYHPRALLSDNVAAGANGNQQSLGQKTMEGLTVTGTRLTESSVSGANTRLAVSYTDSWYSPDLRMDLLVVRNNPQSGQVTLAVTSLVRGEPDSSWFKIPSGYDVRSGQNK